MTGDYTELLKARMPESEVKGYADRLGVTIPIEAATYADYSALSQLGVTNIPLSASYKGVDLGDMWSRGRLFDWWNPPPKPRYFNFESGNGWISITAIGWADGWVYYSSWGG
jgi:hypothetical protein